MLKKLSQPWRRGWEQWKQIANETPNHEGQHLKAQRVSNHCLEGTKPRALHQVVEALPASTYDPNSPEFSPTAMQHLKQPCNYVCESSMGRSTIREYEAEKNATLKYDLERRNPLSSCTSHHSPSLSFVASGMAE